MICYDRGHCRPLLDPPMDPCLPVTTSASEDPGLGKVKEPPGTVLDPPNVKSPLKVFKFGASDIRLKKLQLQPPGVTAKPGSSRGPNSPGTRKLAKGSASSQKQQLSNWLSKAKTVKVSKQDPGLDPVANSLAASEDGPSLPCG